MPSPKKSTAKKSLSKIKLKVVSAPKKAVVKPRKKTVRKSLKVSNTSKRPRATTISKTKSTTRKKQIKDKLVKNEPSIFNDEVSLPTNMSKRSVEKSMVLKNFIKHSAIKVAYVSGVCFALVGTAYASFDLVASSVFSQQTAQVNESTQYNTTLPVPAEDPLFYLISTIPDSVNQDFRITYNVANAKQVHARLVSSDNNHSVNSDNISTDRYRSDIPVSNLPPGYYRLRVYVEPLNESGQKVFETKMFFVQEPELTAEEQEYIDDSASSQSTGSTAGSATAEPNTTSSTNPEPNTTSSTNPESSSTNETQSTSATPAFIVNSTIPNEVNQNFRINFSVTEADSVSSRLYLVGGSKSESLQTTKLLSNQYRVDIPVEKLVNGLYELRVVVKPLDDSANLVFKAKQFSVAKNIAAETNASSSISGVPPEDNVSENNDPIANEQPPVNFIIDAANADLSGTETIRLEMPGSYSFAELYARPINSLQVRFIGLATKNNGNWIFIVDTKKIPNGKYEFYARTRHDGVMLKSASVTKTVNNQIVTVSPVTTTDTPIITTSEREFVPTVEPEIIDRKAISPTISDATNELLKSENLSLNDLFKRYAIAQQSGDAILIETAKRDLAEKRKELVNSSLRDEKLRNISADIDEEIGARMADLEERVNTFEKIRRDKSDGKTAIDTDKDGISDFDEINIYQTDPNVADSDNDGVTDGVEIMRGYDPNDAVPEAIIEFESPKDSIGLVREDVLLVEDVLPVTKAEPEAGAPEVIAEIRGKGLPNSFVTLFIFSEPTVVTVRTDADGSFVYTFDKELADGEHEVYVAVTDNAGEIIAQSNPFSFVKQAQAFTPVDASEAQVVTNEILISETSNYKTVVGLGILAFGLILVMLGISLRPRDTQVVTATNNTSARQNLVADEDKDES